MSLINDSITIIPSHPTNHSSKVPSLTSFDNINESKTIPNIIGFIPIYKDKLHLVKNQKVIKSDSNSDTTDIKVEDGADVNDEYMMKNLVELKKFKSGILIEELLELACFGFNGLENPTIEQILNLLVNEGIDEALNFEWSEVDDVDRKFVYLRLDKNKIKESCSKISQLINLKDLTILNSELKFIAEQNTINFISDTLGDSNVNKPIDIEKFKEQTSKIIENSKRNKKITTDLDYVIDENELKYIRPEDLPQLRKDIKEFRLKVLENEKKKRQKQALEEVKRSKLQLRQLFVKFQKESKDFQEMDVDEDDDSDEEDEDDGLTDEQYEEIRKAENNKEKLKNFNLMLLSIKREESNNEEMIKELNNMINYESSLDQTVSKKYETSEGFRPSHRDKLAELEQDALDREGAKFEESVMKETEKFVSTINIPMKVNLKDTEDEEVEDAEPEVEVKEDATSSDKLKISDESLDSVLEKIKPNVEVYIEEYLGVKEEELLEYILMIIKDTKSQSSLIDELKETFDEDAIAIGEKIWNDVLSNI